MANCEQSENSWALVLGSQRSFGMRDEYSEQPSASEL